MSRQINRIPAAACTLVLLAALAACRSDQDGHGHDEHGEHAEHDEHGEHAEHGHGEHAEHGHGDGHGEHGGGHKHADEHPKGHDHHAEGHGHGAAVVGITRWGGGYELFAEHGVPIAGRPFDFLAHLTRLEDFSPGDEVPVVLELEGPQARRFESGAPEPPGIYPLRIGALAAGTYRARMIVGAAPSAPVIEGFEIVVHADAASVPEAPDHDDDGRLSFLKEQQWNVTFATAFVGEGSLVPSVQAPGSVDTPPGGMAEVSAPIAGRLVAPPAGLPRPGQRVKVGELLANLAPAPSSPEGEARARLALVEAEARVRAATMNLERAQRLIADEAISQRELEDAKRELAVASESVTAAKQVSSLFAGARAGHGKGSWRLTAPISGVVVSSDARPGAAVSPDDVLFRIVNRQELWLKGQVPEQDAARLQPELDGSYRISGLDEWMPLRLGGDDKNASLVALSSVVDPNTRAVEVIYALETPDPRLRIDGLVTLELPVGDPFTGIVVPRSAVLAEGGRSLVYVQLDGEHFEERAIRVGIAAGDQVAVLSGLTAGERIVTRGANLLRLSSRASNQAPHGHIH